MQSPPPYQMLASYYVANAEKLQVRKLCMRNTAAKRLD